MPAADEHGPDRTADVGAEPPRLRDRDSVTSATGDNASDAASAAEAIAPEAGLLAILDPIGLGEACLQAAASLLQHPEGVAQAGLRYTSGLIAAFAAATARAMGADSEGPVAPGPKDRRFRDPAWEENPFLFALLQGYLLSGRLVQDLVAAADLDGAAGEKTAFLAELTVDALAPTNFLLTNPAAGKKALDTGGASLFRGARNFLDDVATNRGLPRQLDPSAFTVGMDLAATPGKVVFRNDLMELIQYAPRTDTVYETPLLLSPPWINKYYIMDLAPGRSFAEWAIEHGHTVFAISYRNPDESQRDVRLDDYLLSGPIAALDTICEITGADRVNVVGLCLGGTLTAMLLSYLAQAGDGRVRSTTLLNTLVDFSRPGRLGAFTDRAGVERLEKRMATRGYLDKSEMMGVFTLMRANDLVWSYVVNNWLLGEDPPPFDILAWNGDGTRMPAAMHSFYIRSCYLGNEFAGGTMELAGTRLDPAAVRGDVYVLAAQEDHIAPWSGSYLTTRVLRNADVRFVLSGSGHIAGIVNPPSPKAWYRSGERLPAEPEEWLAGTSRHEGSWWEDWAEWIGARAGERVKPPRLGSRRHRPVGDAPGVYVLGT
jgi:poly[(R)-3-hydroxyalkanoate] polymerase subunit PhaC